MIPPVFVTHADRAYLPKLVVCIDSILDWSRSKVYVLALDAQSEFPLRRIYLGREDQVKVFGLDCFINDELLVRARAGRDHAEFCWTMSSLWTRKVFSIISLDESPKNRILYVDADTMLFSDPEPALQEVEGCSVGLVAHRHAPENEAKFKANGQFNANWIYLAGDETSWRWLQWWSDRCLERCSRKVGCGDQAYLDQAPDLLGEKLHVFKNVGIGVGPWNAARWPWTGDTFRPVVDGRPLVQYHFHELEFDEATERVTQLTHWAVPPEARELVYGPYALALKSAIRKIKEVESCTPTAPRS